MLVKNKVTLSVLVFDRSVMRSRPVTLTVYNLQKQANWGYLHSGALYRGEIELNDTYYYVFGRNVHSLTCAEKVGEYTADVYQER